MAGLSCGIAAPVLAMVLIYMIRFPGLDPAGYFRSLFDAGIFSSLLSLCVIPNLMIFFIFIWLNLLYAARGVLMATFFFAFVIIIVKFII